VPKEVVADFTASVTGFPVFYAKRKRAKWGSYQQAAAIIECIKTAIREAPDCDRYTLLSGQCYPIKNNSEIQQFFQQHTSDEFIEAISLDFSERDRHKWNAYYRFQRVHIWLGNRRVVLPLVVRPLPSFPVFHGATWWSLSNNGLQYAWNEIRKNWTLWWYFRTGFLVDEAYIPTVLMNSPLADRVVQTVLTFAEWNASSGPHPKVLAIEDLRTLQLSNKLFARKFDGLTDRKILDTLDQLET
jgi:hypothetical protein